MINNEDAVSLLIEEFGISALAARAILKLTRSEQYPNLLEAIRSLKGINSIAHKDNLSYFYMIAEVADRGEALALLYTYLQEQGINYPTNVRFYQSIVQKADYAHYLLQAFQALEKSNIQYTEHRGIYRNCVETAEIAHNLAAALEVVYEAQITFEEHEKLYRSILDNPTSAKQVAAVIRACHQAGIPVGGNDSFYQSLFTYPSSLSHTANAIRAAHKCKVTFDENKVLYQKIVNSGPLGHHIASALNYFSEHNISYPEHVKLIEDVIAYAEDAEKIARGLVALNSNRSEFGDDFNDVYGLILSKPNMPQEQMVAACVQLYKAGIRYPEHQEMYVYAISQLENNKDICEAIITLHQAKVSFLHERIIYKAVVNAKHDSKSCAAAIVHLFFNDITNEKHQDFYVVLLKHIDNLCLELSKEIVLLFSREMNYSNAKRIYDILLSHITAAPIASAINRLHEQGLPYRKYSDVYEQLLVDVEDPSAAASSIMILGDAGITYATHRKLFNLLIQNKMDVYEASHAISRLVKQGYKYSEHKVLIHTMVHSAYMGAEEGIVMLDNAGLLYQADGKLFPHVSEFLLEGGSIGYENRSESIINLNLAGITYEKNVGLFRYMIEFTPVTLDLAEIAIGLYAAGISYEKHTGLYSTLLVEYNEIVHEDFIDLIVTLYKEDITYENSPAVYKFIRDMSEDDENDPSDYKETFIILSKMNFAFENSYPERYTSRRIEWFQHIVRTLNDLGLSYEANAPIYRAFITKILTGSSYTHVLNKLEHIVEYMKSQQINNGVVDPFQVDNNFVITLLNEEELIVTQGPLNKSRGTRYLENVLQYFLITKLDDIRLDYHSLLGYSIHSTPDSSIKLTLLLNSSNLSQATHLSDEQLSALDNLLNLHFDFNQYHEVDSHLLKRMSKAHQHAFQVYSNDDEWHLDIGMLYRGKSIKFAENICEKDKSKHLALCFILGYLLNDMVNVFHKKKSEVLMSEPFKVVHKELILHGSRLAQDEKAYTEFLNDKLQSGDINQNEYNALINQTNMIKSLFTPSGMTLDRREVISDKTIEARISNPLPLPGVTSFTVAERGLNSFKMEEHTCTKFENPPEIFVLSMDEEEVLMPHGMMMLTQRFHGGLLTRCVNSPDYEVKDQYINYLALINAYMTYFSKPYTDEDERIEIAGKTILRPNHGLAHSYRKMTLIPHVLQYFARHAKDDGFRRFCSNASNNTVQMLCVGIIFNVTGRESECSFHDDPKKYRSYQKQSSENFSEFACLPYYKQYMHNAELIDCIKHAMGYLQDPFYEIGDTENPTINVHDNAYVRAVRNYCHRILSFTHVLDLARCTEADEYIIKINDFNKQVVDGDQQKQDRNQLIRYVTQLIKSTGDQLQCDIHPNGNIVRCNEAYSSKFAQASHSLLALDEFRNTVPRPMILSRAPKSFLPAYQVGPNNRALMNMPEIASFSSSLKISSNLKI